MLSDWLAVRMAQALKVDPYKTVFVGKRKEAVARLKVEKGQGKVLINGVPVELIGNWIVREKVLVPLRLAERVWRSHNFYVNVQGGGVMGQADACAIALARAVVAIDPDLEPLIERYDYHLLSGDQRRTEPKKPNRRSARRFKQKSYR
jgi:small subunit ribosomal protein S9